MRLACLAFALMGVAFGANAQPLAGEWYGIVEGLADSEPRRKLVISGGECTWAVIGRTAFPARCSVGAREMSLTTRADSAVKLAREGEWLRGTFALKSGRSYNLSMHRSSAQVQGWSSVGAGEPAERRLCEQPVPYRIRQPSSDIAEASRAWIGVWVGHWNLINAAMCTALIVESVAADGRATAQYVWGRLPNFPNTSAGVRAFDARIGQNRLQLGDGDLRVEYRLLNPRELAGTWHRGESFNGHLTKN